MIKSLTCATIDLRKSSAYLAPPLAALISSLIWSLSAVISSTETLPSDFLNMAITLLIMSRLCSGVSAFASSAFNKALVAFASNAPFFRPLSVALTIFLALLAKSTPPLAAFSSNNNWSFNADIWSTVTIVGLIPRTFFADGDSFLESNFKA